MEHPFHYLTDTLSILVGMWLYFRSREKDGVPEEVRIWIVIGALFGALFGSRLIAGLEDPALFMALPSWLYYIGNKTIIGGIAGGILGIELAKWILGIRVRTGDRTVIPLIVAVIIGRIGCFVTGVADGTVGGPCDYVWCMEQGDGILRHPNSLYEIGFLLFYLIVHYRFISRAQFFVINSGLTFRALIVGYFSFRLLIEFLKETHPLIFGLNSIQLVCISFVAWYACDIARALAKK